VASRSLALTLRQQLIAKINGYVTANIQQLELDNPGVANRRMTSSTRRWGRNTR
jgi:hypothetical protein